MKTNHNLKCAYWLAGLVREQSEGLMKEQVNRLMKEYSVNPMSGCKTQVDWGFAKEHEKCRIRVGVKFSNFDNFCILLYNKL